MNFTGYAMRRFIKNFKGYNIFIEDNEEATASSPYYIGVPELPFSYSIWCRTLRELEAVINRQESLDGSSKS